MTDDERIELKATIQRTIEETKLEIEKLRESTQPIAPDQSLGRLTRMDAIQSKSINEAALRKAEFKMEALERAITNADNEDFGKCKVCGNQIQTGRLMFMPECEMCIRCASAR